MANIINFLKDTKPATSSTSTISTDTQTTKDKPSLFDSLLTNNQNQAEVKSSTSSTTEVTQDKTQIVSEEEVNKTETKKCRK